MTGILGAAAYVPYHRLRREAIAEVMGGRAAGGSRAVASYDEDTTTMAVEAARLVLRSAVGTAPRALWFSTPAPAYLDKTNAAAVHAALRLDRDIVAADFGGAPRSGIATLLAALRSPDPTLVVASDLRTGLPGGSDERNGGDGAAAILTGTSVDGPLIAKLIGIASRTEEFVDRWRVPGQTASKAWEERFGEQVYAPLVEEAYPEALKDAEVTEVDRLVVTGLHARAVRRVTRRLGDVVDDRTDQIGNTGAAHPLLLLADLLEQAEPDQTIAVVVLADGVDVLVVRTTDAIADWKPPRTVAAQIATGDDRLAYGKFLAWRGMLTPEPPRRPAPARTSAPAAERSSDWKFGFVGSRDRSTGALHLPPQRVSFRGGAVDDMEPAPMADTRATVATFTVDKLAYSPSPPTVFAVLDFDGGGRLPIEITDVDPDAIAIGDRMEMTFRRLNEADGIVNYFWKARPVRGSVVPPDGDAGGDDGGAASDEETG